ncbi:MAG: hypothetical protein Q8P41_01555, partial [Pseudomonadota bacterium]|nr:hypothetical protein [Pseudomonadota bacterium]
MRSARLVALLPLGAALLLASCHRRGVRYALSGCRSGNAESCGDASEFLAKRSAALSEELQVRHRALTLEACTDPELPPQERVKCGMRQLWWSDEPASMETGLGVLAALCAGPTDVDTSRLSIYDSNDAEAAPLACLGLGDARTLGRGGPIDPSAAHAAYAHGCAGGDEDDGLRRTRPNQGSVARAETAGEFTARAGQGRFDYDRSSARSANCRRLAHPSSLYDEADHPAVQLVLPDATSRLAQARASLEAGRADVAYGLLASITGAEPALPEAEEARGLLTPLVQAEWDRRVLPEVAALRWHRALAAAAPLAAVFPPDDPLRARLAQLHADAAA